MRVPIASISLFVMEMKGAVIRMDVPSLVPTSINR